MKIFVTKQLYTPVHPGLCARPVAKFIVVYGIPVGVFHAGNNLSAKSLAFSRNMLSPERSYALRRPPSTLAKQNKIYGNWLLSVGLWTLGNKPDHYLPDGCLKHASIIMLVKSHMNLYPSAWEKFQNITNWGVTFYIKSISPNHKTRNTSIGKYKCYIIQDVNHFMLRVD